jgi:pimeloyl-ACP methyl ester carboxylesterase
MQRRWRRLGRDTRALVTLVAFCVCSLVAAAPAQAQIAYAPCADSNDFACGHLTVPLDPSGATPGTITLALRRHLAPLGPAHSAIVALAGGPGQAALPFTEQFSELLGPIADTRDLIVFDQRGVGLSGALSCHALERPGSYRTVGALVQACGSQLGATRRFYTTADTVADIEALRRAGGYEKLVLYGTSYGTKVAEEYAQAYPDHVEALVLDSVVPPAGPEPLDRSTFAAIPRVLRQICARRYCAHTTANPVADLAKVVARMGARGLRVRALNGHGVPRALNVGSNTLLEILLAGDFSPLLRAELVTAVAAAARGDSAPLARLVAALRGGASGEGEEFDTPLYFATTCEEQAFPWSRAASSAKRLSEGVVALRALGPRAFFPFTATNALNLSDMPACAFWPFSTPAPAVASAPLPRVLTLVLSGADDLRTPTANAREVAAQIPGSQLLVVPYTGHSVLGEDTTSCASEALQALFAKHAVKQCRPAPPPTSLLPAPLPPRRLTQVSATHPYGGRTGRTLHAVQLTLDDFVRQLTLQLGLSGSQEDILELPTLRTGGLRAGWAEFADGALRLHGYSYVPGVTVSGAIKSETASLTVSGPAGAHGTLRLGAHHALVGTLGGRHVILPASSPATAAIVASNAVASTTASPRGHAVAARLARLLAGLDA